MVLEREEAFELQHEGVHGVHNAINLAIFEWQHLFERLTRVVVLSDVDHSQDRSTQKAAPG